MDLAAGAAASPYRGVVRWAAAVIALVLLGVFVVDDLATHRDLGDARAERDVARRAAATTSTSTTSTTSTTTPGVTREPILVAAPGVPVCQAGGIRLLSGGADFMRFANTARQPCALLDQPGIEGRVGDGPWEPMAVRYVRQRSYTDGPDWTGVFDPQYVAILAAITDVPGSDGTCAAGTAPPRRYTAVRVAFGTGWVEVPDVVLDSGPCAVTVRLWAYDVTGEG